MTAEGTKVSESKKVLDTVKDLLAHDAAHADAGADFALLMQNRYPERAHTHRKIEEELRTKARVLREFADRCDEL